MARVLSTAFVLALLAATAAAFALTERAKLERSPIYGTQVDPIFSPVGDAKPVAHIGFRVRPRERVEVWIEDSHDTVVATLLSPRTFRPGARVNVIWSGLTSAGVPIPDGVYRPVVKLERSHRTIALPNEIRLDTVAAGDHGQAPAVSDHLARRRRPPRLVPLLLHDQRPAHAILLVRGDQVAVHAQEQAGGRAVWNGKLPGGARARPGRYVLSVSARDVAGNQSKRPTRSRSCRCATSCSRGAASWSLPAAGSRCASRPTRRPSTGGCTDAQGALPRGTLHFRAPKAGGVYRLYVSAGTHVARCVVVVA